MFFQRLLFQRQTRDLLIGMEAYDHMLRSEQSHSIESDGIARPGFVRDVAANRSRQCGEIVFVMRKLLLSPFGFSLALLSRVVGNRSHGDGR